MQTFLPYESFAQSAAVLDRQRLGKQRVENLQIMTALVLPNYGWQNHPAVKLWRGCELSLLRYQTAICEEWTGRGYRDTCLGKTLDLLYSWSKANLTVQPIAPSLVGVEAFHLSHQSNLIRKDPEHYGPLFPGVPDDLPYVWSAE